MRQNVYPNPALKLFESYVDFSGGMNSEYGNERLKDNEFPTLLNVDLSSRASVKRRYGKTEIPTSYPSLTGTAQGMFFYFRQGQSGPDIVYAVGGYLYLLTNGSTTVTQLQITDGGNNNFQFQSTLTVEGAQYKDTLYVATGTKLVGVKYDTTHSTWSASTVTPYTPTVEEAIYIGTNALAPNPSAYIQNGTATQLAVVGIQPQTQTGAINVPVQMTAFINAPSTATAIQYQWQYKRSVDTNWTTAKAFATNQQTYTFTPPTAENYDIQVTVQDNIADPTAAPSLQVSGTGSTLAAATNYVAYDFANEFGRTKMSPVASISVASGQDITTSITMPANTANVGIYVGTPASPLLLGTVSNTGAITYAGTATAGLSVSVNGSTLSVTISAPASSTGAPGYASNTTVASPAVSFLLSQYVCKQTPDPDPTPYDAIQTCRKIRVHWDRMLLFCDNKYGCNMYISDTANPAYFPSGYGIKFDELNRSEAITAHVRYRDNLFVFTKTSTYILLGKDPSNYQIVTVHDLYGCISDWGACLVQNNVMFLSQEGIFALEPNSYIPQILNVQRMDWNIRSELPKDTNACAVVNDEQFFLYYPNESVGYRLYYNNNMWVKDQSSHLNIVQCLQYDGTVYNLTATGHIYKHDKTVYTDCGEAYQMVVESKYYDFDASFNIKKLKRMYVLGRHYQTQNTDYEVTITADAATVFTPEKAYASIVNNTVVWNDVTSPNIHFLQGSVLGSWVLGQVNEVINGNPVLPNPLGTPVISVQLNHVRGKCRRTKIKFVHTEPYLCELFGFGFEFKLKKPY